MAEVEGAVVNKLNQVKVKQEEFQISCILLVGRDLGRSCCGASWPGFLDYTAHCSIRYPKKLTGFHFDAQPGMFIVPGGTTLFEFSDNWCRAEAHS